VRGIIMGVESLGAVGKKTVPGCSSRPMALREDYSLLYVACRLFLSNYPVIINVIDLIFI
jgi:hypothetical protein